MCWGAGIAQWLEHRTRDWKVAGSNPCWNGGRIFFSRVDFLCWLLFRYPFHPRVTTVARKKSRSFCQKCRWQVTAKHAYTLRMWILLNRASALVTTCPWYVKWHLRTLSINSSSSPCMCLDPPNDHRWSQTESGWEGSKVWKGVLRAWLGSGSGHLE